jgi:fibronectin-binding autotransporter adhesin
MKGHTMLKSRNVTVRRIARFAFLALLVFALCGAASAQTLTCPVASNLNVSGTLYNFASTCVVDSGVALSIASTGELVNDGPEVVSGILINDGTINNGGILQNQVNETITNFGTILNNNYLDIDQGTLTNAGTFDNFGTVTDTVTIGTLNNAGTLTNTGAMTLLDTVTNTVGAQFNNTGTLSLSGYFVEPFPGADSFTNNGTLTNFAGGVILAATVLTNNGSIINRGTFYSGGVGTAIPILTNNGTITNYGTFTNAALEGFPPTIYNNGTFDNFGTLNNQSTFYNNAGGSVINEAGATLTVAAHFENDGALTNNGAVTITGPLSDNGTLTNNGSIAVEDNGARIGGLGIYGTLTNKGSIAVNGGSLLISGGTLTNFAGSTFVQTAGQTEVDGTMNSVPAVQIQGGLLTGGGTINGNVDNSGGNVTPGFVVGPLTINGNYTQGSNGTLTINLFGDEQLNFLDVSDLATLDGTLDFVAESGFAPVAGDDFTFLFFGSLSGDFARIDFINWSCPTGDTCEEVVGANSLSLDITGPTSSGGGNGTSSTPEPSSLLLLVAGTLALGLISRRKRGEVIA